MVWEETKHADTTEETVSGSMIIYMLLSSMNKKQYESKLAHTRCEFIKWDIKGFETISFFSPWIHMGTYLIIFCIFFK